VTSASGAKLTVKTASILAIVFALVHLGLALWFASFTPYRSTGVIMSSRGAPPPIDIGAPDERQHVNYVKDLVEGHGFPVLRPTDPHLLEHYQAHQPPLYYLLEAGWTKLTGVTDLESQDSGLKLRALNALIGAGGVFAVFLAGLWGFRRPEVGVIAASMAALLPMNVALSGAVSNDPLLFLISSLTIAFLALAVRDGWNLKRSVAIGVLIGLGLLTKTTALSLGVATLVAIALSRPGMKKPYWALALVVPLVIYGPWMIRNQSLYGDPFAISAFNKAFVGSPQAQPFIEGFGLFGYFVNWVGWWTFRAFLGAFGYMDIFLNETGLPGGTAHNTLYRLFLALTVLIFAGWVASWKSGEEPSEDRKVHLVNLSFTLVVALLFVRFNLQYFQAQARYIMPAVAPIAIAYALGGLQLAKGKWLPVLAGFVLFFGGITIYAGLRVPDEFAKRVTGPSIPEP
jgi:4-amino-4-deoxy-L-arabinose transferase-like glycosyltransferase